MVISSRFDDLSSKDIARIRSIAAPFPVMYGFIVIFQLDMVVDPSFSRSKPFEDTASLSIMYNYSHRWPEFDYR